MKDISFAILVKIAGGRCRFDPAPPAPISGGVETNQRFF